MKALSFAALALFVASPALAQVGHDPESSPYRDLEYRQELTPYGGYTRARVDPAGVHPQSAAMAGLRYELYLGGPVSLTTDLSETFSDRTVIDPFGRVVNGWDLLDQIAQWDVIERVRIWDGVTMK